MEIAADFLAGGVEERSGEKRQPLTEARAGDFFTLLGYSTYKIGSAVRQKPLDQLLFEPLQTFNLVRANSGNSGERSGLAYRQTRPCASQEPNNQVQNSLVFPR